MAILICPECGGKVSDKAPSCPHCGYATTPSVIPPHVEEKPTLREVGLKVTSLVCPSCGNALQAKDVLSSGWAHCPFCDQDFPLEGSTGAYSDGIIEKIYPFEGSKEEFHKLCMQRLMLEGEEDIFREMNNVEVKQKYVWTREFGVGIKREVYPMDEYGKKFFVDFTGKKALPVETYGKWWPASKMVDFSSDIIRGKEIVSKELSVSECKYQYMTAGDTGHYDPTDHYYCFPIYEETFEYKGKTYGFQSVGNGTFSEFQSSYGIPQCSFLSSSPEYKEKHPCARMMYILSIIAVLFAIIEAFSDKGFWLGLLYVVIGGLLLWIPVTWGILLLTRIVHPIDSFIQNTINKRIRKRFRKEYDRLQSQKQQDARNNWGIDLTYEVPEYPIPTPQKF